MTLWKMRRYVIVENDRFADDRDQAVLNLNGRAGPEYANAWYKKLAETLNNLPTFPGPFSHARDESATEHYGREVRRLLYYGPTKKRSWKLPNLRPSCCLCFTADRL